MEQPVGSVYFKGNHRAVLLFHAYSGTPNDVRLLGRMLNNAGYTVLLPLFSGHGTKEPEDILASGANKWRSDMQQAVQFLQAEGHQQIAAFGLSLGGVYAMNALEDFPEVVIGGGTFCSPLAPDIQTNIEPVFLNYAERLLQADSLSKAERDRRLVTIKTALANQMKQLNTHLEDVYERLPEVTQPTMLVQAAKDTMIDPQLVYSIQKKLTRSQSRVYWYENSGHVITIGPDKKQLQADVEAYLTTLPWLE